MFAAAFADVRGVVELQNSKGGVIQLRLLRMEGMSIFKEVKKRRQRTGNSHRFVEHCARSCSGRSFLRKIILILLIIFSSFSSYAIAGMQEKRDIPKIVQRSNFIIRGKVISTESQWKEDSRGRHIYTTVTVKILDKIKGNIKNDAFAFEVVGGIVDDIGEAASGTPVFEMDEEAIIFLAGHPLTIQHGTNGKILIYDSRVYLDDLEVTADSFIRALKILEKAPGATIPLGEKYQAPTAEAADVPIITDISFDQALAVTITGTNFGSTQGSNKVEFFNKSRQQKIPASIVSWSNTQIICTVPANISAGSSPVTVTTSDGTSSSYIILAAECYIYEGYKWFGASPVVYYYINQNTSDCTGEGAAVQSAADTWNNVGADFTFQYGGSCSSTSQGMNGTNCIMWGTSLSDSTVARAYKWYYVSTKEIFECDIVFNDLHYTWSTDQAPPSGKHDVESVALHELGHWLNLKDLYDLADSDEVMYGYISSGQTKRELRSCDCSGICYIYGGSNCGCDNPSVRLCSECEPEDADLGTIGTVVWGYSVSGNCGNEGKWVGQFVGEAGATYHFDLCPDSPGSGTNSGFVPDVDIKITNSSCTILDGEDGSCSSPSYSPNDYQWICPSNGTYYVIIAPYSSYNSHNCTGLTSDTFTLNYYSVKDEGDAYEPDNTAVQANEILPDSPQTHSIAPVGEVDYVWFSLDSESEVVIETSGLSGDTEMWLYDDQESQIEYNDDGGAGWFSRIERTCGIDALSAGTYYVKVAEYGNNDKIDSYDITLTVTPCAAPCCPTTITSYPYTESFESDFGDWVNTEGDDIDWTRHSGSTTSTDTGPSSAHDATYYLYTEASGSGYPNKQATLDGPCFDMNSLSNPGLRFWYHMYGGTMGTLTVEVSDNNCASWTPVWNLSGDQGDSWYEAVIDLSAYSASTLKVKFVGVTGSSYNSDMAIDYITVGELLEAPFLHPEPNITPGLCNLISWDAVPEANEYYAECSADPCFSIVDSNSGWIADANYEFCGLINGQEYWYRVKSGSTGIESPWSEYESSRQCDTPGDFEPDCDVDWADLAVFTERWLLPKWSMDVIPSGGDGIVNFLDWTAFANGWQDTTDVNDMAVFVDQWLQLSDYFADLAPAPQGDGKVNFLDFAVFAENWLEGVSP